MNLKEEVIEKIKEAKEKSKYFLCSTKFENHIYPYEIQNILTELGYEFKHRGIDANYDDKQSSIFDYYYHNSKRETLIHTWNGFYGYNRFTYINMNEE